MRSLASMTGTGDLSGGDTLAGGGAAEGGDRILGLLLSATAGAPRALPARRGIVSGDICCEMPAGGAPVSLMTMTSSSSLVVGYVPAHARCISLASLALKGLRSRRACRHCADGCKHNISACIIHEYRIIYTCDSRALALHPLHLLLALILSAPCPNFFDTFTFSIPGSSGPSGTLL